MLPHKKSLKKTLPLLTQGNGLLGIVSFDIEQAGVDHAYDYLSTPLCTESGSTLGVSVPVSLSIDRFLFI